MYLKADGMNGRIIDFIVDKRWNMGPSAFDPLFQKVFIQGYPRIAFNADQRTVAAAIENDRLNDAAIRQNRLLELFKRGAA